MLGEVSSVEELLRLLGESPAKRAVVCIERENGLDFDMVIAEFTDGNPTWPRQGKRIARVLEASEAAKLLDMAMEFDDGGDLTAWSGLPVRYGPYCSTWVLPEHPKAPRSPGSAEE